MIALGVSPFKVVRTFTAFLYLWYSGWSLKSVQSKRYFGAFSKLVQSGKAASPCQTLRTA